jgi:uncharacterized repeat protein (TIGR01451 family)
MILMRSVDADRLSAISLLMLILLAGSVLAGNNPDAKVAVHVVPHDYSRTCTVNFPEFDSPCHTRPIYVGCDGVDVFPVFFDLVEYQGFEYSLTWPGSESCVFTSCSDLHIGNITASGEGISQVWFGCRHGLGMPGFGWIEPSEPARVCVTPHPIGGAISILDCAEGLDQPWCVFCAGVCGEPGDDPCDFWGHIEIHKSEASGRDCVHAGDTLVYALDYESTSWNSTYNVSIIDHLPPETEYVSSSPAGTYDADKHTVTWYIGEVPEYGAGSVEVRARLRADSPTVGGILNICAVGGWADWDSTYVCHAATRPATWGEIKSMFR